MSFKYNISRLEFIALALLQKCHITTEDMTHLLHVRTETTWHSSSVTCEFIFSYALWDDVLQQPKEIVKGGDYYGQLTAYWSVSFEKSDNPDLLTGKVTFGSPTLEVDQVKYFDFLRKLV